MRARSLVLALLRVSEKAARLARTVRAEQALFELLVQEKTGADKNKRFVQDFKTLGDVLVQETVQHDLGHVFPSLAGHIHGEESNTFTNALGETVTVEIRSSVTETAELLARVLDGDLTAATLLAEVVHSEVKVTADLSDPQLDAEIPDGGLGVWIDPIDSTAQYINGHASQHHESGVYTRGLQSVLVLVGVYDLLSGTPVAGVVNQPFCTQGGDGSWSGRHIWGMCPGTTLSHSPVSSTPPAVNTLVVSANESPQVSSTLAEHYTLLRTSGGGYKLLCAAEGLVSGFVLSTPSCFKWDTCAPHAILKALGGGVLDLRKALDVLHEPTNDLPYKLVTECQLCYQRPDREDLGPGQTWCNSGGVLAYRDINVAVHILQTLAKGAETGSNESSAECGK